MASALTRGSSPSRAVPTALSGRSLALVAAGCAALKLLVLAFDHGVLLHSDSGNYVRDAFALSPSWPRPIAYGIFLRAVFELPGGASLTAVLIAQSLLGAAAGTATFALVTRFVGASVRWGLAAALLVTLSPLALVVERYILSDTLGLTALVVALLALHRYVSRPTVWSALLLGLGAVLPQMVRAVWVFGPPILIVLGLVGVLGRGTAGRLRAVGLAAVALTVSVLSVAWYSAEFTSHNAGEVNLASGGSGYSGWVLWGSVARFAEPDDLQGFDGAEILLSDHESLQRNGSWQIWDFRSTANQLREQRFGGSFAKTNRPLLQAALRVAVRHPIGFARQLGWSLLRFFRPIQGNNDYSRLVNLHPGSVQHIEEALGAGSAPDPVQPPRIGGALRAWRWVRWWWSALPFAALAVGLWRPRRHFPALAVGSLGVAYLMVVNIAIGFVFIERYYLPVEYLSILALTALAAAWARSRDPHSGAGRQQPAEAPAA